MNWLFGFWLMMSFVSALVCVISGPTRFKDAPVAGPVVAVIAMFIMWPLLAVACMSEWYREHDHDKPAMPMNSGSAGYRKVGPRGRINYPIVPIDKGIPLPKASRTPKATYYPWDDMEVGDSFLMFARSDSSVGTMIRQVRKKHPGWELVRRWTVEGIRIWRTA